MPALPDPLRSGPQLHCWRTGRWLVSDDLDRPVVVLVHGLGASSKPLDELASYLDRRFRVVVFNYRSHEGIDRGGDDLGRRLGRFQEELARSRFALIGHSMGGLVSKYLARHGTAELRSAMGGLATLGTPHAGAAQGGALKFSRRWISMLLRVSEGTGDLDPYSSSVGSPALQQLLGTDPRGIVGELLRLDREEPLTFPMLTLSGGLNRIELFPTGSRLNAAANRFLQANLRLPNDGLVEESSANLQGLVEVALRCCRHCNEYGDWCHTNHTYLVTNQDVGELLGDWLDSEVFPVSETPASQSVS